MGNFMKKVRDPNLLSVYFTIGIVLIFMFVSGCSKVVHESTVEPNHTSSSETTVEEWRLVENPNTGKKEMKLINKVHTTKTTTTSVKQTSMTTPPEQDIEPENDGWNIYNTIVVISSVVIAAALVAASSN